jgi:hypothetical protein
MNLALNRRGPIPGWKPKPGDWVFCSVLSLREGVAQRLPSIQETVVHICSLARVSALEIRGEGRTYRLVRLRHVIWFVCVKVFGHSLNKVARVMGNDHSSVIHGTRKVEFQPSFYQPLLDRALAWARELVARSIQDISGENT